MTQPPSISGTVAGTIGLVGSNGEFVPCSNMSVYLFLRPVDIEAIKRKATIEVGTLNRRLANLYVGYVMSSPDVYRKMAFAKSKTDAQGNFQFSDIPPDRWYYVVAQAQTGSAMVSWQIGVHLGVGETVHIHLANANAVLPIYVDSEDSAAE